MVGSMRGGRVATRIPALDLWRPSFACPAEGVTSATPCGAEGERNMVFVVLFRAAVGAHAAVSIRSSSRAAPASPPSVVTAAGAAGAFVSSVTGSSRVSLAIVASACLCDRSTNEIRLGQSQNDMPCEREEPASHARAPALFDASFELLDQPVLVFEAQLPGRELVRLVGQACEVVPERSGLSGSSGSGSAAAAAADDDGRVRIRTKAHLFAELLWSCDWSGCVGVVRRRLDGEVSESDGGGIQAGREHRVERRFLRIFRLACHLFRASASLCARVERARTASRSVAALSASSISLLRTDKARDKSRRPCESTLCSNPA